MEGTASFYCELGTTMLESRPKHWEVLSTNQEELLKAMSNKHSYRRRYEKTRYVRQLGSKCSTVQLYKLQRRPLFFKTCTNSRHDNRTMLFEIHVGEIILFKNFFD